MDWYGACVALTRLKMSPVFECVHYTLMSMNMKEDLQQNAGAFPYARHHPLASWFATMMICFAGGVFNCLLFGTPFATLFLDYDKIAMASVIWYAVNFVPGLHDLLATRFGKTCVITLKEVQRVYGVYGGVLQANKAYPNAYLFHWFNGFIKGSAAEIMMFFARAAAGVMKPNLIQFVAPNVVFKASVVLSMVFCLEAAAIVRVDHHILFASVILVLLYFRICMIWGWMGDPFKPIENLVCSVVFGGMWDAWKRAVSDNSVNNNSNGEMKKKN